MEIHKAIFYALPDNEIISELHANRKGNVSLKGKSSWIIRILLSGPVIGNERILDYMPIYRQNALIPSPRLILLMLIRKHLLATHTYLYGVIVKVSGVHIHMFISNLLKIRRHDIAFINN